MKKVLIAIIVIVALCGFTALIGVAKYNSAINQDEDLKEAYSDINVQVKNRNESLTQLIGSIESYNKYEGDALTKIVEARNYLDGGDFEKATAIVQALYEAYPELNSIKNYETYNNEVVIQQNKINALERDYNAKVASYRSYVRKFPNKQFLSLFGYEIKNFETLDYSYEASQELPSFSN